MILHPRTRFREIKEGMGRALVMARLHKMQYLPPENTNTYIQNRVRWIIDYCRRTVPFYSRIPRGNGDPELSDFPVIDKDTVRGNRDGFVSSAYDTSRAWRNYSSGSTGQPMEFLFDRHSASVVDKATYYFGMFESGFTVKDRLAKQARRELYDWWMDLGFMREKAIPILGDHLQTIRDLVKWRADCLYVSPSLGEALARANETSDPELSVRLTFASNENLFSSTRDLLEESFEGRVVDRYGSAEFPGVAWTCPEGNYHLIPEQLVEILDENDDPVASGERGRLVITTLHNLAMPLVRYDTQDLAIRGEDEVCECGCRWPYLSEVEGRIQDLLVDREGWGISPIIFSLLGRSHGFISRYRVEQRRRGEAEILLIPPSPDIDPRRSPQLQQLIDALSTRIDIDVRVTDQIEEKGEKRRIVRSRVRPARLGLPPESGLSDHRS
jgi:phenylacetate-CoA ligase